MPPKKYNSKKRLCYITDGFNSWDNLRLYRKKEVIKYGVKKN